MFFATSCCCSCCCCIVCNPLWKLLKCCLRDLARPGPASASASAFAFACSSSAAWSVIINFWRLGTQQGNHTELHVCVCVWLIHKCISRNIDGSTCGTDAGKVWGGGLASICYETHVLHKSKARRREGGEGGRGVFRLQTN